MKQRALNFPYLFIFMVSFITQNARADENLFGYVRGAETMPSGSWSAYQILTSRTGKGMGTYRALDAETEVEYGLTDRLSIGGDFHMQSIYSKDLLIDAYIPKDVEYGLKPSAMDIAAKYNFLSPAKDDLGLSTSLALERGWLDPHSGQKKDTTTVQLDFLLQKYFLEGQLICVANVGMESTHAKRYPIEGLPADFEWPTHPEMEIGLNSGLGLSYRFLSNWFVGAETVYESEYETEVGEERWSWFAGPSLHVGEETWWSTLTYFPQIKGGPTFPDQDPKKLQLVEKTEQEVRLKVGYNF
jgi:hypothetical protein